MRDDERHGNWVSSHQGFSSCGPYTRSASARTSGKSADMAAAAPHYNRDDRPGYAPRLPEGSLLWRGCKNPALICVDCIEPTQTQREEITMTKAIWKDTVLADSDDTIMRGATTISHPNRCRASIFARARSVQPAHGKGRRATSTSWWPGRRTPQPPGFVDSPKLSPERLGTMLRSGAA